MDQAHPHYQVPERDHYFGKRSDNQRTNHTLFGKRCDNEMVRSLPSQAYESAKLMARLAAAWSRSLFGKRCVEVQLES
jgi:hypothetical protein